MIKGCEPIIVNVPPIIAAKPIGIIRLEAETLMRFDRFKIEGRKITTAPMFWIKPERRPTAEDTMASVPARLLPAALKTRFEKLSILSPGNEKARVASY
ncbi:MAG: hypothetical protein M0R49_02205 [Limnochordia bacterium]|jgi:hypothetical protein|nr:hypothetical protein [Limnochordia bacterium]